MAPSTPEGPPVDSADRAPLPLPGETPPHPPAAGPVTEPVPSPEDPGPPLLVSRHGSILVVTLNRPHRLNAVTRELYRGLRRALAEGARGGGIRAVVITGAGRAFCVGADLRAHGEADPGPAERRRYIREGQRANRALLRYPWPVIAAVNGHAIGAGLELALSADLVVVAEEARLRLPEVGLGTFVGGGVTRTLPLRVGEARSRELVLLGSFFSPLEAVSMGLANEALPSLQVLPRALELAEALTRQAPLSLKLAKRLLRRAPHGSLSAALAAEEEALLRCMETEDWREGIQAFHEKRSPSFTGR
jgi:enoyl-CoA hydratase